MRTKCPSKMEEKKILFKFFLNIFLLKNFSPKYLKKIFPKNF